MCAGEMGSCRSVQHLTACCCPLAVAVPAGLSWRSSRGSTSASWQQSWPSRPFCWRSSSGSLCLPASSSGGGSLRSSMLQSWRALSLPASLLQCWPASSLSSSSGWLCHAAELGPPGQTCCCTVHGCKTSAAARCLLPLPACSALAAAAPAAACGAAASQPQRPPAAARAPAPAGRCDGSCWQTAAAMQPPRFPAASASPPKPMQALAQQQEAQAAWQQLQLLPRWHAWSVRWMTQRQSASGGGRR